MTDASVTRRGMLGLVGGAALAGCSSSQPSVAGDTDRTDPASEPAASQQANAQGATVRAFLGSYHWGFFLLDETGSELDGLSLSPGDELRLTAFNVEADTAVDRLPGAVSSGVLAPEERARRNRQRIPTPQGVDLDDLHEAAEATYPDHGLAVVRDEFIAAASGGATPGPGGMGSGGGGWGGMGPWGGQPGTGWGHHAPGGHHGSGWGAGVGGVLAPPTYLWHHATVPAELGFVVETTGSFGFGCPVYCGYGHPYMVQRGRIAVRE